MKKLILSVCMMSLPVLGFSKDYNLGSMAEIVTESDGYVFMRSAPNSSAKKILKLNDYTTVKVHSCSGKKIYRSDQDITGNWCKVSAKGKTGYVFSAYLNFY